MTDRPAAFRVTATATFKVGEHGTDQKWERTCQIPTFEIPNAHLGLTGVDDGDGAIYRIASRIIDAGDTSTETSFVITPVYRKEA